MTTQVVLTGSLALLEEAALERILADSTPDPKPGRPRIVLCPKIAELAIEELAAGRSYQVVARRCGVSKAWLVNARRKGDLQSMVEGRMGQPTGPQLLRVINRV